MEREIVVDIKDVSKEYESQSGKVPVLKNVSISINKGEFVGIVGDSGSGKTTLLNLIGGMDCVSSGSITVAGDVISDYDDKQRTIYRRKHVGFIFQDYNLINELTVYENIILPFQLKKKECKEEEKCIPHAVVRRGAAEGGDLEGASQRTGYYSGG